MARSAITVGDTPVTLREREIALRTAAGVADDHLNRDQRDAVAAAVFAVGET
jgi:hypothetical protein